MFLTPRQKEIIVGALLGDGTMRCKRNALFEINHSSAQRSYVDWMYRELSNLVGTPPHERIGNGIRRAYRFTTLSLPELTPLFHAFYRNGVKGVPDVLLTPLALAVWFMDDGCQSRSAIYFNTQQFSVPDQVFLLALLERQHRLLGTLNRDKQYSRIRIRTESIDRFIAIVGPHLLPEMRYKLPVQAAAKFFESSRFEGIFGT